MMKIRIRALLRVQQTCMHEDTYYINDNYKPCLIDILTYTESTASEKGWSVLLYRVVATVRRRRRTSSYVAVAIDFAVVVRRSVTEVAAMVWKSNHI